MYKIIIYLTVIVSMASHNAVALEQKTNSAIGFKAYEAVYKNQGASDGLPKVLVFSPKGECVGITTVGATPTVRLTAFIDDSLKLNKKNCDIVVSDKFGVTEVGKDSGTGKSSVLLITLAESFCTACTDYKNTLIDYKRSNTNLSIVTVDLTKKLNPDAKPIKDIRDCKECSKK